MGFFYESSALRQIYTGKQATGTTYIHCSHHLRKDAPRFDGMVSKSSVYREGVEVYSTGPENRGIGNRGCFVSYSGGAGPPGGGTAVDEVRQ